MYYTILLHYYKYFVILYLFKLGDKRKLLRFELVQPSTEIRSVTTKYINVITEKTDWEVALT